MPQFYTLLTDPGQAKIANAVALGTQIEITQMAVGDGGGNPVTPNSSATALVNEIRRAPINAVQTDDDNPSWIVIEQVLPPDVGGWTIREVGVFDAAGDLIAIGNLPETYKPVLAEGSSRTQTIRVVMEVSDTAAVTLKVDPSVVLATREYVDQQRLAHEQSRNHPAATTAALGFVEKATIAEAKAGTADKFPDAAGVRAAVDAGMARQNVVVFDVAGTNSWEVPQELKDGRRKACVTVIGGGAGGGHSETSTAGGAGGGGGGAAYSYVDLTGVETVAVTVGAGGAGKSAGSTGAGGVGGTSSFGSYLSCTGGSGGSIPSAGSSGYASGSSFVALDVSSASASSSTQDGTVTTGSGGGYGGAGAAAVTRPKGEGGKGYGGGGAGGTGTSGTRGGGDGADGAVIIEW